MYKSPNGNIFHAEPRPEEQLQKRDWEVKCPETFQDSIPHPFDERKMQLHHSDETSASSSSSFVSASITDIIYEEN